MVASPVVVLGASPKPHRYANKAIRLLLEYGYAVLPVHPKLDEIENLPVKHQLGQIDESIDTLTLYLGEKASTPIIDDIVKLKPRRVIMNPGTESAALESALAEQGIDFVKDCTLVMLREGRF